MIILTNKPPVGSRVNVAVRSDIQTRWRKILGLIPVIENYSGLVVDLWWLPASQFALATNDDVKFPVRVISVAQIVTVTVNGEPARFKIDVGTRTVNVASSRPGATYQVKVVDGTPVSCTCPGFGFRRSCKHLAFAKND